MKRKIKDVLDWLRCWFSGKHDDNIRAAFTDKHRKQVYYCKRCRQYLTLSQRTQNMYLLYADEDEILDKGFFQR